MYKLIIGFLLTLVSLGATAQPAQQPPDLLKLVNAFAKTGSVAGREEEAARFLESLFPAGTFHRDRLGNLIITIGSGLPRRLFTASLDEPGYVISQIQDNGYLRIAPLGVGQGKMYHQFLQGNEISINTDNGIVNGVAVVPSAHFEGLRIMPERVKNVQQWQETVIDVGLSSAQEVAARGIKLLDPLTINKKPVIVGDRYLAASSAKAKSAVIALAGVARTLMNAKFNGSVVIAFTVLDLINGKGLEDVAYKYGPFTQVVQFNNALNGEIKDGADLLVVEKLPVSLPGQKITTPQIPFRPAGNNSGWLNSTIYSIGLPSAYVATPVEMVDVGSIQRLSEAWLRMVDDREWTVPPLKYTVLPTHEAIYDNYLEENKLISKLISLYGVSGAEKPVRDYIVSALPEWAHPATDAKGNIIVTFGKGRQRIAFVAHMDEVGYVVDTIRDDGKLVLRQRGGFFNFVWEGHAAVIHGVNREIPAVFEPRANYLSVTMKTNGTKTPIVYAGFTTRQQALDAGITEGATTVTMPKQMIRLSDNKATARGFDDRAGCAAVLLALKNLNPAELPFKVTIVFSVEEETGLAGSIFAAKSLQDIDMVYPIDTFVSSDDPVESKIYANCPLGNGAVVRVLESVNIVRRSDLNYLHKLAAKNNIKTQYGMTAGGTDGQEFLRYDIPSVPLSWPGRYSHSPIEIMDFRDLHNLVLLVKAIMTDKAKVYN